MPSEVVGAGKDVVLKSLSRPGAASYSLLGRDPWLPTYEERVPALHRIGKWENYPLPCWQPAIRGAIIFGFALTLRHQYTQVPVSLPYFPWRCGNQHCAFGSPSHCYCETIGSVFSPPVPTPWSQKQSLTQPHGSAGKVSLWVQF